MNSRKPKSDFPLTAEYFVGVNGSDLSNEIVCKVIDGNIDGREIKTTTGEVAQVYSVSRTKMEQLKNNSAIKGKITFYSRYGDGLLKEHIFTQKRKFSSVERAASKVAS